MFSQENKNIFGFNLNKSKELQHYLLEVVCQLSKNVIIQFSVF